MRNSLIHILLTLVVVAGLAAGCSRSKVGSDDPAANKQQDSAQVRPVVIFATADGNPLYHYVESQGIVKGEKQVTLQSKIGGFIKFSHIADGRWVHKGDTLLAFRQKKWRYALQKALNNYKNTRMDYRQEMSQRRSLPASLGGESNPDTAKVDSIIRIITGFANAQVALKQARLDLSHTTITAPFSGRLATDDRITAGAFVPAGTTLGQLVNVYSVRVRFDVLENEVNKIKPGMAVRVTSPGGQTLKGAIVSVSPVVHAQSKTGEVTARVRNAGRLLSPGMTVDGRILVQKETGKARIPRAAILSRDGGRQLVFKLNSKNDEVEWIYVHPAAENSQWAIVNNPKIAPGDTLAVNNSFSLSHLEKVQPKMRMLQPDSQVGQESNK
jgi:RND family efflux transporter MFP subunit